MVVDLETTGGSPRLVEHHRDRRREGPRRRGARRVPDPGPSGEPIPPFIAVLTGITDAMVATAPPHRAVLPAFLEFARGCVLVAHNAPFDMGFLRQRLRQLGLPWPASRSVDTALLARRVLTRDETPNCKLATLALFFRASVQPTHRALADARATVDVLHGLFERLGGLGVTTMDELRTFTGLVRRQSAASATSPTGCPHGPASTSSATARAGALHRHRAQCLRTPGAQLLHGVRDAHPHGRDGRHRRAASTPCRARTRSKAEVRELRLIAEHKPRYNRRSRWPERSVWLKLTVEPFPRLSQVRVVRDDGHLPRPVRLQPPGRAGRHRDARGVSAAPMPWAAASDDGRSPRASLPRWAAAALRATAARAARSTPSTSRPCVMRSTETLGPSSRPAAPHRAAVGDGASKTRPPNATGWPHSCGRRPRATAGSARRLRRACRGAADGRSAAAS